jgi:galactose-6-phosphate isomerase
MLDVTDVLLDQDLGTEFISVIQRPIVMVKGRATVPAPVRTDNVAAVVNSGVSDLDRAKDQQNMPNKISVHTLFRLTGPAKDAMNAQFHPSQIIWRGDYYVVSSLDDYSKYGAGFVRADCSSVDSIDSPPGTE